jgi:hypothetical protein
MQHRSQSKEGEIRISGKRGDDGKFVVPNIIYVKMIRREAMRSPIRISAMGSSIKRMYDLIHGYNLDGKVEVIGHKSCRIKTEKDFISKVELVVRMAEAQTSVKTREVKK